MLVSRPAACLRPLPPCAAGADVQAKTAGCFGASLPRRVCVAGIVRSRPRRACAACGMRSRPRRACPAGAGVLAERRTSVHSLLCKAGARLALKTHPALISLRRRTGDIRSRRSLPELWLRRRKVAGGLESKRAAGQVCRPRRRIFAPGGLAPPEREFRIRRSRRAHFPIPEQGRRAVCRHRHFARRSLHRKK